MSANPEGEPVAGNKRTIAIRLPDRQAQMLAQIAVALSDGSKSRAVELLVDMYGGKILERAAQDSEGTSPWAPFVVTRWRSPKLDERLIAYVAGIVRVGNMAEMAFQLAGVAPRARQSWLKRGRADRAAGKESLYADLVAAVERAEAECEAEDLIRLREHGKTTWTALAWRLERQFPDRYAQRKRIDGKVEHSLMPMIDWDRLNTVETRTLVELLRKASPDADDPAVSRSARPALELLPADVVEADEVIVADAEEAPALEGDRQELGQPPAAGAEAPALDGEKLGQKPGH